MTNRSIANSIVSRALLVSALTAATSSLPADEVSVAVDTRSVINTMRGGIGASWHAIEEPISTTFDPVFGLHQHGGSGWGGSPPAENEAAWNELYRHASWLGMDFLRVELEQRMYEPQRRKFDWDNPEMRILYRILDWCQKNEVDVFLTQMWSNVKWNAFPEFSDTPAGIVHSGPLSMDDFAEGLATCVEHLVRKKGYTCIKWLCITNEPTYKWSWWNRPPNEPIPLKPGLEAVRKALDRKKLAVPLSAPDTVGVPELDPQGFGFAPLVGAYDFHSYGVRGPEAMTAQHRRLVDWATWAHERNCALFLSELGFGVYEGTNPAPGTYEAALHNAELVVRHLGAGVDGFNRWSFNNRGDLDGQFQMVDTWDPEAQKLLEVFSPHANPYFVYGLLSRFTAKHSDVLAVSVDGGNVENLRRVFVAGLRSPNGNLTLLVLNNAQCDWDLACKVDGLEAPRSLHRYGVSAAHRDRADLKIEPATTFRMSPTESTFRDRVAPRGVTIYTSYKRGHVEPGVIVD